MSTPAYDIAYTAPFTGAVVRTGEAKFAEKVSVKDFGAIGDGSTDDTAKIQAAINYLGSLRGGELYFPPGRYKISAQLTVGFSDIRLIGAGRGDFHYTGTSPVAATELIWAGAASGVMVRFTPAGSQWLSGCALDGIYLNGGAGVQRCLEVYSSFGGRYIVTGQSFLQSLFSLGCSSSITETADSMQNYIEVRGSAAGNAALLQLTGISNANSCFNRIGMVDGNYEHGTAIQLYNCDNNVFEHIRLYRQPGAMGVGIAFNGGVFNQEARSNLMIDCSPGEGGVVANGTGPGVASASKDNYIMLYDTPNAAPLPSYGVGASLWYGTFDSKFPCVIARANSGVYGVGPADVSFPSEVQDLQNSFSSTAFTAPKPGNYRVKWTLAHTAGVTPRDKWLINIVTPSETVGFIYAVIDARDNSVSNEALVSLRAGETVRLRISRADGSGVFPVVTDNTYNRFEVNYVSQGF